MSQYDCAHVWMRDSHRDAIYCSCGATMSHEELAAADPEFLRELRAEFARRDREYDEQEARGQRRVARV